MAAGRYHWSNCAFSAKFFVINAAASLPWLAVLLFPRWSTLIAAIVVSAFLIYIEVVKKMTLMAFLRSVGVFLTGRVKSTRNIVDDMMR